jgi:hypothetical protein
MTDDELAAMHNDEVMTHHVIVRDGPVWRCDRCRREVGTFGEPMPRLVADCDPRRWGDGQP